MSVESRRGVSPPPPGRGLSRSGVHVHGVHGSFLSAFDSTPGCDLKRSYFVFFDSAFVPRALGSFRQNTNANTPSSDTEKPGQRSLPGLRVRVFLFLGV